MYRKPPVELGEEYEADILEMSQRGDAGVAKIQGFVIFVSGTKVGQHVKFVITKVGNRYAVARPVEATEEAEAEEPEEEEEQEEEIEEDEEEETEE